MEENFEATKQVMPDTLPLNPPRRFTVQIAWTMLSRVALIASAIGANILIARWLGPQGLGVLAVINAGLSLLINIGCMGIPSASIYFIAQDRKRLGSVWANSLIFAVLMGSAFALGTIAVAHTYPTLFGNIPFKLLLIAACSLPPYFVFTMGLNTFLGLQRVGYYSIFDVLPNSLMFISAGIVLIILGQGLTALVTFNAAVVTLVALMVVLIIWRLLAEHQERPRLRPSRALFKEMARYGIKFHIATVAAMLLVRLDLLLVNHYRGPAEAGVYATAGQVVTLLMLLPGIIAALVFPRVAAEPDEHGEFTMRVTRYTAFVMLLVCLITIPAGFLLPMLYGAAFSDATVQMLLLLPGVYLLGLETVLVQHFSAQGLPIAIPLFWLATLATNATLNLLFIPVFGARAAAIVSTVSYTMIFILVAFYFRLKTGNSLSTMLFLRGHELREMFTLARIRIGFASR